MVRLLRRLYVSKQTLIYDMVKQKKSFVCMGEIKFAIIPDFFSPVNFGILSNWFILVDFPILYV